MDLVSYVLKSLEILIINSIPQTFIFVWFSFLFLGIRVDRLKRRILWFTIAGSVYLDISFLAIPLHFHMLNSIGSFVLILFLFFRELKARTKLLVVLVFYISVITCDVISVFAAAPFITDFRSAIVEGPVINKIIFLWPWWALVAIICILMNKYKIYPAKSIALFVQKAKEQSVFYFLLLILFQTIMATTILTSQFLHVPPNLLIFIMFGVFLSTLLISFLSLKLIARAREQGIQMTQNAYVGDLMQMLTTIRGQRHDFLNHIQVISSMITLKKYEQLQAYIQEVAVDIATIEKGNEQLPSTALTALVQAKYAIAIDRHIRFSYQLPESLEALKAINSIDLVRMVGNLVDNAYDAVEQLPNEQERRVELAIEAREQELVIRVRNSGSTLTPEEQRMIFTPGYTTKAHSNSGLGLSIVQELVKKYEGTIQVSSSEQVGVAFELRFPVKSPQ